MGGRGQGGAIWEQRVKEGLAAGKDLLCSFLPLDCCLYCSPHPHPTSAPVVSSCASLRSGITSSKKPSLTTSTKVSAPSRSY